jgi:pilus assembly protein Flp/PilA
MLQAIMGIFGRRVRGQALVEYGLILVLVAIAVIVVLIALGGQLNTIFSQIVSALGG